MLAVSVAECGEGNSAVGPGKTASETAAVRNLISVGIDDLAKYRIVQLFLRNQGAPLNAQICAADLGLRSAELTDELLAELAQANVISADKKMGPQGPYYRWPGDLSVCRWVTRLLAAARVPGCNERLLRSLALRSLAKSEARARTLKGQGDSGRAPRQFDQAISA